MDSNPTLLDEIQEQHKLMKLKLMVQKYGIKSFNVSDTNLALKLIPFILKHVEFTDAIADAMQCLNAYHSGSKYEIIVIRCQHLIEHNEMKRLESLLQNGKETDDQTTDYMEDVDKESVLKELDTWISLKLERLYQKSIE
jgi:hypothetical protein